MSTSGLTWAVLLTFLSSQPGPPANPGATLYVQPDVLLVRAKASPDAAVLTRLPINHPVTVENGTPTASGYISVSIRNEDAPPVEKEALVGFVRADMLGPRQTPEALEARLKAPGTPAEEWMLLERLVALRGTEADTQRLSEAARKSGDRERLATARRLQEPTPLVVGVCFRGRVAVLGQFKGQKFESFIEQRESTKADSPEVRAAEARLRARALELTTLRFSRLGPGTDPDVFLVQPEVVTVVDIVDTARSRIELGPCPRIRGESSSSNAWVFVSAPLGPGVDTPLPAAELAGYVAQLPSPVHGLRVFNPGGRLVELNTRDELHLFQRGTPKAWACSTEACESRKVLHTKAPVWLRLRSGQQLRIGSRTEDVDNTGWGSPANEGLWVHPEFVIHLFDDKGGIVTGVAVLAQYGC